MSKRIGNVRRTGIELRSIAVFLMALCSVTLRSGGAETVRAADGAGAARPAAEVPAVNLPAVKLPAVKVFVLAGQSNMEGKAKVSLMETQAELPATRELYGRWRRDGKWTEREDVWVKFLDRRGKLTVGFGSEKCIGPELGFGEVVGDRYEQPVLLIKTAWGGKSLYRDFRPPSAGLPPGEVLEAQLKQQQNREPAATLESVKERYGASYRAMLEEVRQGMAQAGELFPELAGRPCELAGFVWFQGWNDMIDPTATGEYAANLAHFIRDVRRDLHAPQLPFVVAQMGVDGPRPSDGVKKFKQAQAEGAGQPEFAGNVALVKTDALWDLAADEVFRRGWRENLAEWNKVGSDYPYHYLGSPRTMLSIGKACGEAILTLRAGDFSAR